MRSKKVKNTHIVKINIGEKVSTSLKKYIKDNSIQFGKIEGIGALEDIKIGILSDDKLNYNWKEFPKGELLTFNGNIAWDKNEPVIHVHATLADENCNVFGGHFGDAKVYAIMEIFITEFDENIRREHDGIARFKTWNI